MNISKQEHSFSGHMPNSPEEATDECRAPTALHNPQALASLSRCCPSSKASSHPVATTTIHVVAVTTTVQPGALGGTVTAIVVMITSHDSAQVLGMTFEAKYNNSPTFKYFVVMNAIASGYSIIVLFFPSKNSLARILLVTDTIMTLLLDSSISACLALGQLGKKGNSHAGWLPICGQVPKFCDHVGGALIAGFAATVLYFILVLYSFHNVLNLYSLKA
nr:CASP-like protein 1C1 [Ipomoea trifida]GMD11483.1 CASP-like protein 1C1 [Ipomoea batatas]